LAGSMKLGIFYFVFVVVMMVKSSITTRFLNIAAVHPSMAYF